MSAKRIELPPAALRRPSEVMKLEQLGSLHSSRLSFTRTLVRRMHVEKWRFGIGHKSLDGEGYGHLVYLIQTPSGPLSFIAFSTPLDDTDRTDRVIAERWDMSFTLFNGMATEEDVSRLSQQVPLQEAGRMSEKEIVMSRANKSVRLFNSVVSCLVSGRQPAVDEIASIGYLVRTTAVYGNGKFGLMDFEQVRDETPFGLPFQAEMLTVYMARQFSLDLIEHVAQSKSKGKSIPLSRALRRGLGVGNATGLGMAPFLVSHPQLIHQWIWLREIAISRVKSVKSVTSAVTDCYAQLLERVGRHLQQWHSQDERQAIRIQVLREEVSHLQQMDGFMHDRHYPWACLTEWAYASASLECSELIHSLMLELYPDLVNELDQHMGFYGESEKFDVTTTVEQLRTHIEKQYAWALDIDFSDPDSEYLFWYFSAEKEEPRLGERYSEPGAELEMRVDVARDVSRLYQRLRELTDTERQSLVGYFMLKHPEFRHIILRIQSLGSDFPYAEIQDNLLAVDCLPINLLRCKLAIFGATRFDPKSDLWTRITLFQGAPLMDELEAENADDWVFPVVES